MAGKTIAIRTGKTYRPEELASALGISGKVVRAHLRKTYTRPSSAKGSTWVLTAKQSRDTLAHFAKRNPGTVKVRNASKPKPRAKVAAPKPRTDATPSA